LIENLSIKSVEDIFTHTTSYFLITIFNMKKSAEGSIILCGNHANEKKLHPKVIIIISDFLKKSIFLMERILYL